MQATTVASLGARSSLSNAPYPQPILHDGQTSRPSTDSRKVYLQQHAPHSTQPSARNHPQPTSRSAAPLPLASDSIYQDLIRGNDNHLASSSSSSYNNNHRTEPDRPRTGQSARQALTDRASLSSQATVRSRPAVPPTVLARRRRLSGQRETTPVATAVSDLPFLYSDPVDDAGSVMTGMSQQELLRKKARADRHVNKRSSHSKKKKKDRIVVTLPQVLTGIGTNNKKSHVKVHDRPESKGLWRGLSSANTNRLSNIVEPDLSTAESTHSDEGEVVVATIVGRGKYYETPYSTVPAQQALLHGEADDDDAMLSINGQSWDKKHDAVTARQVYLDEEEESLFPILSTNAGGFSVAGTIDEDAEYLDESTVRLPVRISIGSYDQDEQGHPISSSERRGVRFHQNLASQTLVYNNQEEDQPSGDNPQNDSEIPWDERADDGSPRSVMADANQMTSNPADTYGQPKSILRPAKFSGTNRGRRGSRYRGGAYMDPYYASRSDGDQCSDSTPPPNTPRDVSESVSKSPPRNGSGFTDHGVELSPISQRGMDHASDPYQSVGHPAERGSRTINKSMAFREMVEKANHLYPDPSLDGNSIMSESVLSAIAEKTVRTTFYIFNTINGEHSFLIFFLVPLQLDDDATIISTFGFIQTVAAIVIQAAFRRYRAILIAERLRLHRKQSLTLIQESAFFSSAPREFDPSKGGTPLVSNRRNSQQPRRVGDLIDSQATKRISQTAVETPVQQEQFEDMAERMYLMAAIRIQSAFRGFWVRDCISVDHYCAKVIQKTYRGYMCRYDYQWDLYRIVKVQSIWRKNIARVQAANLLGHAILLQAICRGFLVRKQIRDIQPVYQIDTYEVAAVVIQARWRGFSAEMNFIKSLVDVLIVQTIVRRWLAIRRVTAWKRQLRSDSTVSLRSRSFEGGNTLVSRCSGSTRPSSRPPRFPVDSRKSGSPFSNVSSQLGNGNSEILPPTSSGSNEQMCVPGGTKAVLSIWETREKKNAPVH